MIYSSPLLSTVESSVADSHSEPVGSYDVTDRNIHDGIFTAPIMIDYMYKIDLQPQS